MKEKFVQDTCEDVGEAEVPSAEDILCHPEDDTIVDYPPYNDATGISLSNSLDKRAPTCNPMYAINTSSTVLR